MILGSAPGTEDLRAMSIKQEKARLLNFLLKTQHQDLCKSQALTRGPGQGRSSCRNPVSLNVGICIFFWGKNA